MATKSINPMFTAAQHAAYDTSPYGEYGGGRKFIDDLIAGNVQRLDSSHDPTGVRAKTFTMDEAAHATIRAMARAQGKSMREFVRSSLFGPVLRSKRMTLRVDSRVYDRLKETAEPIGSDPEELAAMVLSSASLRATELCILLAATDPAKGQR